MQHFIFTLTLITCILCVHDVLADDKLSEAKAQFLAAANFNAGFYPQSKDTVGEFSQVSKEIGDCQYQVFLSLNGKNPHIDDPVVWASTAEINMADLNLEKLEMNENFWRLSIETIGGEDLIKMKDTEPQHPGMSYGISVFSMFYDNQSESSGADFRSAFIALVNSCQK